MLQRIAGNGVRTIIVETANRFARDLMVQEVGYAKLQELGIELVAADSPNAFLDDGPTSKLIRQVLGAVAEFDKAMTVAKLRGARERKRRRSSASARAANLTLSSGRRWCWRPSACVAHCPSTASAGHSARSAGSSPLGAISAPAFSASAVQAMVKPPLSDRRRSSQVRNPP